MRSNLPVKRPGNVYFRQRCQNPEDPKAAMSLIFFGNKNGPCGWNVVSKEEIENLTIERFNSLVANSPTQV